MKYSAKDIEDAATYCQIEASRDALWEHRGCPGIDQDDGPSQDEAGLTYPSHVILLALRANGLSSSPYRYSESEVWAEAEAMIRNGEMPLSTRGYMIAEIARRKRYH